MDINEIEVRFSVLDGCKNMNIASSHIVFIKSHSMKTHESFNKSDFGKFINSPKGRVFRLASGLGFLALGCATRHSAAGKLSMIWALLPLSAAILDLCYVSAMLGGPISGEEIRGAQEEVS